MGLWVICQHNDHGEIYDIGCHIDDDEDACDDNDIYGMGVTLTANWQQGCSSCIPWPSPVFPLPTTDHSRLPLQQAADKDGDNDVEDYHEDDDQDDEAPPALRRLGRDKTQRCQMVTTTISIAPVTKLFLTLFRSATCVNFCG